MKFITDKELQEFITETPLYSKIQFCEPVDGTINLYEFFENKGYKGYCPYDKDYHTFKFSKKWGTQIILSKKTIEYSDVVLDKEGKFYITFRLDATCQICNYKSDFLFNLFSLTKFRDSPTSPPLFIRKIGQFPAFERQPENDVYNYLNDEDKENYKKALSNLSVSYGIGAFAYFRRIIENEIKRLVKDISELDYENVDKVRKAWDDYERNHQMSSLIDSITQFLPRSLKEIGDNPIKTLYEQTSGGLHEFSDEICLQKSIHIDRLLKYVIKRISSLKHEYLEARQAIKGLMK